MKKELYEKPEIEIISLINIDIITSSPGEGGDTDTVTSEIDNDFVNKMNEIDLSPWTRNNEEGSGHSFFDDLKNAIDEFNQEGTPDDNISEDVPIENEEIISDDVATDEIPIETSVDDNIDAQ